MGERCIYCGCKLTEKNTMLRYERWTGRLCDNCGELRAKIQNEIDRGGNMMNELKPCPICKSKVTITHTDDGYIPHCTHSMCILSNLLMKPRATKDEAAMAWNRRADNDD